MLRTSLLLLIVGLGGACGKATPPSNPPAGTGGRPSTATGGSPPAPGATGGMTAPGATGGTPGAGGVTPGTGGGTPGTGGTPQPPPPDGMIDTPTPPAADPRTTVVLFLIDGLTPEAARTAAANGANNLKMVIDGGVTVTQALSTSPAARTVLPNNSLPWGGATSGNVTVHTGTHVLEANAQGMDDIFHATRAAGMKSVFAGGSGNYSALNTANFAYSGELSDETVVNHGINHLKQDKVRLLRLHLQRIRDAWGGPADKTSGMSGYVRAIIAADVQLGRLIQALKDEAVWDRTFLVITADHGMGQQSGSNHPASTRSSWDIFMGFYGPGLKQGATIPYAESPDVAVTTMHFFGLPPLKGHTAASVMLAKKGPTGTLLTNLFAGAPAEIPHPRYVDQYLKMNTFGGNGDNYLAYRSAMLDLIK